MGPHQRGYEPASIEEAQDLQNLTLGLIEYFYIEPATLVRMRWMAKRPKTP
ncbi:hypothetical protein [Nocardia brevicatena]|uniref:hypothetical protein n=1 Tax=Nocardia brevicatena TaxID=37327 RepID=UPI0003164BCB|nr:hypothetical protein [Nocardia brevicatena]